MVNRVWNVWCAVTGADPTCAKERLAFNLDPRVALLSSHGADLVEETAAMLWRSHSGTTVTQFLDLWLARVMAVAQREEDEAARRHRRQAEAAERDRRLAEEEQACKAKDAERRRRADAEARRQQEEEDEQQQRRRAAAVRRRIGHLYNITSLENLRSIAARGILCHELAARVAHEDVADHGVQERRDGLHQYASLYLNPRNAMLSRLHTFERHEGWF